ncbi:MAG: thio(seleno)oxazole modification radical SAM maturase SbtM [Desulfobacteraceae bacterium]|jgi:selenobiotic family peptide radical SAM maturase|nr:thio(seleno)oxazole modification radical SAM maturase SbtM [Desulfobacteraceae bacterium]
MKSLPAAIGCVYPACCRYLAASLSPEIVSAAAVETFPDLLAQHAERLGDHPFLPDLARIEQAVERVRNAPDPPGSVSREAINPTLQVLEVHYTGLPEILRGQAHAPAAGPDVVLVWKAPGESAVQAASATGSDLLALKIVCEKLDHRETATSGGVSLGHIENILFAAAQRSLLLSPPSRIARPADWSRLDVPEKLLVSPAFTLQWHITQACDLNCRHCYDRSDRSAMPLDQAMDTLDELYDFCRQQHVYGQVSFTGGNPLLYPHFDTVYREAAERGLLTAILGNPAPRRRLETLCAIRRPEFYQVSLEGLQDHNDDIRGGGHFHRVMEFLEVLGELGLYRVVMLTLTAANVDQVLPLAQQLEGRVELFTFNRLSPVGQGASLRPVPPERFRPFLSTYLEIARNRPHMALKDNFFNLLLAEQQQPFFGGCTGFGCGAAFNFVSLLPDCEVHACRKFPSPIGHLARHSLAEIYESAAAERYRQGSLACTDCRLRPVCRGCMAVVHGFGQDPLRALDPYCFGPSGGTPIGLT